MESSLHKRRRKKQPRNPRTPAEAADMLEAANNPYSHIHLGSVEIEGERASIFGLPEHVESIVQEPEHADGSFTAFVDATFGIVPKMQDQSFYQVLLIQVNTTPYLFQ
jgi:hypothetical protein